MSKNKNKPSNKNPKKNINFITYFVISIMILTGIYFTFSGMLSPTGKQALANTQPTNSLPDLNQRITDSTPDQYPSQRVFTEEMVPDLITEGTQLLNAGDVNGALVIFEKAAEFNSDYEELYFNYAYALSRKDQDDKAIEMYEKAILIWPEYSEALNNLANLQVKKGNIPEAIPLFLKAIDSFTEPYPKAHTNLGKAYAKSGDLGKAIDQFTKAIELDTKYLDARINLGTAYFQQNRFQEAVHEFETALRIDPSNNTARSRLNMVKSYFKP